MLSWQLFVNIIYRYKDIIYIICHHMFPTYVHMHNAHIIHYLHQHTNDIYTHRSFYRDRRCDGFNVISLDTYSWRTTAAAARTTTRKKCMVINDIYPMYLLCLYSIYFTHYTATLHYTIVLYRLHTNQQYWQTEFIILLVSR